jgi:hypothetical protein
VEGIIALYIFMLAAFTGYEVISRVPVILHTPLMSGSNFVHGIVLVGAMVALGLQTRRSSASSASSASCSAPATRSAATSSPSACSRCSSRAAARQAEGSALMFPRRHAPAHRVSYLLAAFLFILGLKQMSSPVTARAASSGPACGMVVATLATFLSPGMENFALMSLAIALGGVLAWWSGKRVAMTDMPQMIALYNGMGGGSAAAIAASSFQARHGDAAIEASARPAAPRPAEHGPVTIAACSAPSSARCRSPDRSSRSASCRDSSRNRSATRASSS